MTGKHVVLPKRISSSQFNAQSLFPPRLTSFRTTAAVIGKTLFKNRCVSLKTNVHKKLTEFKAHNIDKYQYDNYSIDTDKYEAKK